MRSAWHLAPSFVTIIAVFLMFADLFPKRLGMNDPERFAVRMVGRCRC
jgi:CBS domain containing-hemolysin-like protein